MQINRLIFISSRFQLRPTSIEKEIFPAMATDQQLYAFELKGKNLSSNILNVFFFENDFDYILLMILNSLFVCFSILINRTY